MSQTLVVDNNLQDAKNFARIMYVVHAVLIVASLGTLSLIALIINYVKRPYTEGTFVHSHHTWMIRTFWFSLLWALVGWFLWFTIIGPFIVWGLAWVWYVYRIIRGFIDLDNNKAMPV